jgi:GntR family transcriptional regulator, rspAB operon transcriptional repressor
LLRLAQLEYIPGNRATYAEYLKANSIFHGELARASHNNRLESMVTGVLDELQRPLYLGLDVGLDANSATEEHMALVQAIKDRDVDGAQKLQKEQITRAAERMADAMRSYTSASKQGDHA